MAASSVSRAVAVEQTGGLTPNRSPVVKSALVPPLSRKRSRSGSRLSTQGIRDNPDVMSSTKTLLMEQYTTRDQVHIAAIIDDVERNKALLQNMTEELKYLSEVRRTRQTEIARNRQLPPSVIGSTMELGPRILYPMQRKRPGNRKTKELHVPKKDRVKQSDQIEELVPIRLDLEFEKLRLRDTFTWSAHDRTLPVDLFAEGLIEDFRVPPEAVVPLTQQVCQAVQEQLADYYPHPFIEEEPLDPHLPYFAYKNDELRMLIKLNITLGNHTLVDQFDWDVNNPVNSPEQFARQMGHDLSLSGEFVTAIAHSIREQAQLLTRGLYITQHPFDGRPVEDAYMKEALLPSPIPSVFRPFQAAKDFTPYFYELSDADLERTDVVFQREQRQQKRSVNRRGGPTLPDLKDRLKTWRTMVVSTVVPGAAETSETSGMVKVKRSSGRGAPRRSGIRGERGEDSDVSESEDSEPDSPPQSTLANLGTTRTRGIRGAATAAQAAMRAATMARSQTPEVSHQQQRRLDGPREDSAAEPTSLILRLKLPPEKFRQWLRDRKARMTAGGGYFNAAMAAGLNPGQQHQQLYGNMAPPPSTPGMMQRQLPGPSAYQQQQQQYQRGMSNEPVNILQQQQQQQHHQRMAQMEMQQGQSMGHMSPSMGRYDYGRPGPGGGGRY